MTPSPKPSQKPKPRKWSSIPEQSYAEKLAAAKKLRSKSKPIARKAAPKKRNPKRANANRKRAYGEYAVWIRRQPCCACGYAGLPSEAAHTATGGTSRKADATTLAPLCTLRLNRFPVAGPLIEGCHRESHRGVKTFEKKHHVDLKAQAVLHRERFLIWKGTRDSLRGRVRGEQE